MLGAEHLARLLFLVVDIRDEVSDRGHRGSWLRTAICGLVYIRCLACGQRERRRGLTRLGYAFGHMHVVEVVTFTPLLPWSMHMHSPPLTTRCFIRNFSDNCVPMQKHPTCDNGAVQTCILRHETFNSRCRNDSNLLVRFCGPSNVTDCKL